MNISMEIDGYGLTPKSSYSCHDPSVVLAVPQGYRTAYIGSATLNAVFSTLAVLGNSLILAALPKITTLKPPSRVLIASLALSDLIVGLAIQPLFVVYIVGGLVHNPAVRCYARVAFGLGSDYVVALSYSTMTAISLERFLHIRLALRYRTVVTSRRTAVGLGISWLLCGVFPAVRLFHQKLSLVFITLGFFICLGISSFANVRIYKLLRKHEAQLSNLFQDGPVNSINLKRYRKFLRMVLSIFAVHLLCYLPSMGIPVVLIVTSKSDLMMVVTNFVGTLLLCNSALNPFLYFWHVRQMRKVVRRMIHCD